jgi:hypothetical protein
MYGHIYIYIYIYTHTVRTALVMDGPIGEGGRRGNDNEPATGLDK